MSNPRIFGSVALGDESSTSDLDLLVDFSAGIGLFEIFRLQDELTAILGVEVDIVGTADLKSAARTPRASRPPRPVTRLDADRLDDITVAINRGSVAVLRGGFDDDLVLDAVRVRLIEIGEAVKSLSDDLRDTEPDIPWKRIARMRNHLAHRYFMTSREVVRTTVEDNISELDDAVVRMRERLSK